MLLFLGVIFFFPPSFAYAGIIINEVMYDLSGTDAGREWIEIYNNGDSSIDLVNYKFFEANTNHGLILFQGEANLNPQSYAIISSDPVKFKIDWPSFSGVIFNSNFSLSNEGEDIAIKNEELNIVDSLTYSSSLGGAGDGNSIQKTSNSWSGKTPTPGTINEIILSSSGSDSGVTSNQSGGAGENIYSPPSAKEQKIKTKILAKTPAFVGIPIEFKANTTGYSGEILSYGKYFWNFGDGDFKEIRLRVNETEKFTHTYFYPGEYSVSLAYYMNYYSENPEAADKILIKIIEPNISISNVGNAEDFFIELFNQTDYEADISNWLFISDHANFTLPKNTILGSKKKMILAPQITGFSIADKSTLKLMTPQRMVVYDYNTSNVPAIQNKTASQPKTAINNAISPIVNPLANIPVENLTAAPLLSEKADTNSTLPVFAFVLFLGATSSAVYFLRRKRGPMIAGDDFELVDE